MKRLLPLAGLVATALALSQGAVLRDAWSPQEVATLASMHLKAGGPPPADPSNRYESKTEAAALGRALFNDTRLSANGKVSCASCHAADKQFQDGRPLGEGVGTGKRRTMPVLGASHSPFLFWDGRKDSLWSQALGPMEDPAEHGGNRVAFVRVLQAHYAREYRAAFGDFPDVGTLPAAASPNGTAAERSAWEALPPATRDAVNRAFANMGKAIAAYERQLAYGDSRFDRYVAATQARDPAGQAVLTPTEVRGLRLFLGKAQCATCHNGPQLSDHAFHNTGVPPRNPALPDRGRIDGAKKLLADEFNCLGKHSDAKPDQCGELQFLATDAPDQLGAFRTPSLRNVAERAPYMHAGQVATLDEVIRHYVKAPPAAVGHTELAHGEPGHTERKRIVLSEQEIQDLAAFLGTLSSPIVDRGALSKSAARGQP